MSRAGGPAAALLAGLLLAGAVGCERVAPGESEPGEPAIITEIRDMRFPLIERLEYSPPDSMEDLTIMITLVADAPNLEARAFYCSQLAPIAARHAAEYPDLTVHIWVDGDEQVRGGTFQKCPWP